MCSRYHSEVTNVIGELLPVSYCGRCVNSCVVKLFQEEIRVLGDSGCAVP